LSAKTIFIIDDEADICELVELYLAKTGFKTRSFYNAGDFFQCVKDKHADLILLDLMLPDMDGLEICRRLKSMETTSKTPIIMLTARGEEMDRVLGLELGADDYVTKPFSPRELVARIKAVLRRTEKDSNEQVIVIGDILYIDVKCYNVKVKDKHVNLTRSEFKILNTLARRPGWVFSREQLLESLWGQEKTVIDRTIDVHIKNLREKLEEAGSFIKSVRGIGYKLEK